MTRDAKTCNVPGCRRERRAPKGDVRFGTCSHHLTLTPAFPLGSHSPLAAERSDWRAVPATSQPPPPA